MISQTSNVGEEGLTRVISEYAGFVSFARLPDEVVPRHHALLTPLNPLPFFIECLKQGDLFKGRRLAPPRRP